METIISYIENLFRNYPNTPEVRKAKEELTNIMEDKYQELKSDGKTENEAIGIVISEFGNMEELAEELGIADTVTAMNQNKEYGYQEPERHLTMTEAKQYLEDQTRAGKRISIGVAMCILSVLPAAILDAFREGGFISERFADAIGLVILFLIIAAAVALFITTGLSIAKYEEWKKDKIVLDYATTEYVKEIHEKHQPAFAKMVTTGVVLCILSIIPGGLADELLPGAENAWIVDLIAPVLFIFIAVGVVLFINAGMKRNACERLLNKGEYSTEKRSKSDTVIGIIAAIYWPVATVIYLGWSFVTMDWWITWIVWPIAGILFGGIAAVCGIVGSIKNN